MQIAICDDEKTYSQQICTLVGNIFRRKKLPCNIELFEDGASLLAGQPERFDLVLLDIRLGAGPNGIETARQLGCLAQNTAVIFLSAYLEYAPTGYEVNGFRYLLKGREPELLEPYVSDLLEARHLLKDSIAVKINHDVVNIFLDRIVYIESNLHKITIHLRRGQPSPAPFYGVLARFEKELAHKGFLRIHKSYLANLQHIHTIRNYQAFFVDDHVLPIGESRFKTVKAKHLLWKGRFS